MTNVKPRKNGGAALQASPQATTLAARWHWKWVLLAIIAVSVAVLDQYTKHWAHNDLRLKLGGMRVLYRAGEFFSAFTYVRNPGAAWGLLANASESFRRPFFFCVSLIAAGFILRLFWQLQNNQRLLQIALSLVLGGAIGNFIDRLFHDYVVDFIDVRYATFRWPTFNVADVAISTGVGLLLLDLLVLSNLKHRRPAT